MPTRRVPISATILFVLLLSISGCTSWSTYPPVEITGRLTNPSFEPMPTLMTESIRFARSHYGKGEEDFAINLPEGVPHEIYTRVIRKLGGGHPQTDPAELTYHILELRIRGIEAEVDLVYPRSGSIYELVTISFSRRLVEGWVVLSSRLWRIHVDRPDPHYVAPAESIIPDPSPQMGSSRSETRPETQPETPTIDLLEEGSDG